ncbi:MAG: hypothetical protein DRM97_07830 [Thermoprotei archaeon]|nr:MAG: hypothetical protein DRM97_07830 [Thermoprotei archaeon]
MKILLLGGSTKPGTTEYHFTQALRNLGHEVKTLCYADNLTRTRYDLIRFTLESPMRRIGLNTSFMNLFRRTILETLKKWRPDLCLIVKGEFLSKQMLEEIHEYCNIPLYDTDVPRFILKTGSLIEILLSTHLQEALDYIDLIATPSKKCVQIYQKLGARKAVHIPFACNPQMHYVPLREKKLKTVLFAGALYPRRTKILRELIKRRLPIMIYTGSKIQSKLLNKWVRKPVWGRKFALLHNISRIGLNIHIESDLTWKANMRTFEIPASGTLLLTDNTEVVKEYFIPRKEIETWDTFDELIEKIDYYLSLSLEDILSMIENGQKRAIKEHTYGHRMMRLIESLKIRAA